MGEFEKGNIIIRNYGQEYKFKDNALLLRRGKPLQETGFEITAAEDIKDFFGDIIYKEGDLIVHSLITDSGGMAEIEGLAYGRYNIYETKTAKGYRIHDEHIACVELNLKVAVANIESELILGSLKVRNTSEADIDFSISDGNGNTVVKSQVETGCAIGFDEMLPTGTYHFRDCNNNETEFAIANDTDIMVLEVSKDSVAVKTSARDSEKSEFVFYRFDDSGKPLMGAVFGLIDICGTRMCFSCSDREGRVMFKHLCKGFYLVKEIEAPLGYTESEKNILFTIDDNWVNQSERIKRGEKFEDVYIAVAGEKHGNYPDMFMRAMDSALISAAEDIIKAAGIILKDD